MNVKTFLSRALELNTVINAKLRRAEQIRELAQQTTASYGGEHVGHSRNVQSLQDAIADLVDTEADVNADIDRLVDLKLEIAMAIRELDNMEQRLVLAKRYIGFQRWDAIAKDLRHSSSYILGLHRDALNELASMLARERSSSMESAFQRTTKN